MKCSNMGKRAFFAENLLNWYSRNGREFVWRKRKLTPYETLILEFLLQKTKSQVINDFFPDFLSEYPDLKALANASKDNVEKLLEPLGLSRVRSERMVKSAKILVDEYESNFPKNAEDLKKLPGVGDYIAKALLCFGFNKWEIPPDINAKRLFGRFFEGESEGYRAKSIGANEEKLIEHAKSLGAGPKSLAWSILDFGGVICKSKPSCEDCLIKSKCSYYEKNNSEI